MLRYLMELKKYYGSEKGQGLVEYALLLAFIAAIVVGVVGTNSGLEATITSVFTNINTALTAAAAAI